MKTELKYFSGTGNSWKIADTCSGIFAENNYTTSVTPIKINGQLPADADIIGFFFPVYAFGIPRICRRYLKQLQRFEKPQNVFVVITAGKQDESGFSVGECVKILRRKNCQVIYTAVVEMPINWTASMNPPSEQEAIPVIEEGVKRAREIAGDIINGVHRYHSFNIPADYGRTGLYKEYYLFRYLGVRNLWRTFKVYDSCNGCGTCEKICPTGSITMMQDKPSWSSSCEQCMRCVNYCPRQAVYQTMGGGTNGRNRYHMPDFRPTNMR